MSSSSPSKPFRKSHRKKVSALRLSSDTTSALPEYIPTQSWYPNTFHSTIRDDAEDEEDKPPDYPDSAEEADEDTDQESHFSFAPHLLPPSPSLPPRPLTASPRRSKRFLPTHKRRKSGQVVLQGDLEPSDHYLDALLERSVHALEMSNTLLQSSISTQTSLTAILASDYPADSTLEVRARNLSSRINNDWETRAAWADDLEEITKDVEGLFWNDDQQPSTSSSPSKPYRLRIPSVHNSVHVRDASGVSCSLPSKRSPPMPINKSRRRPSLDLRQASNSTATGQSPGLSYSQQDRSNLISPPPRALTQYVSANDTGSFLLPSTIGLQAASSTYPASDWKPLPESVSASTTSLLLTTSSLPPKLTDKLLDPATPAYNMLSSFVYRSPSSGSNTPSTSLTASFISRRRDSSSTISTVTSNIGVERARYRKASKSPESHRRTPVSDSPNNKFYDRATPPSSAVGAVLISTTTPSAASSSSSRSNTTPKRGVSPMAIRPMTPPTEESASSSDSCMARRTVQSLRKILDEQALQQNGAESTSKASSLSGVKHLRPPAFMPRSPPPVAEAGTSTATASISRLFTKGRHSSSTRAPSPPRQSAMKRSLPPSLDGSLNGSPLPSPLTPTGMGIPDVVSKVLGTPSSSGRSTPSRRGISFAQLPESYGSTKPGGAEGSKFRQRRDSSRKRRKRGMSEDQARKGKGRETEEQTGWWGGFLSSSNMLGLGTGLSRHEERMEDRTTRNWGSRLGSSYGPGGLDDWAV